MNRGKLFSLIACLLILGMVISGCATSNTSPTTEATEATAAPTTAATTPKVLIPDITEILESDGRNVLSSMGLIPKVEYVYDDNIPEGNIISCSPACGTSVDPNTKVTVYVSKGPSCIYSKDSYCSWTYITRGVEDDWEFYNPYIEDDTLYIHCYNVTFGTAMSWRDRYNYGVASGTACVNDTFDKTIPVNVQYTKLTFAAGESQSFVIAVPLSDLDTDKPTDLYFRIGISVNGQDTNLEFNFSMTW